MSVAVLTALSAVELENMPLRVLAWQLAKTVLPFEVGPTALKVTTLLVRKRPPILLWSTPPTAVTCGQHSHSCAQGQLNHQLEGLKS